MMSAGQQSTLGRAAWEGLQSRNQSLAIAANDNGIVRVATIRVGDVVRSDVLWYKTDTQGNDFYALRGSSELFRKHSVPMVETEYDPVMFMSMGVTPEMILDFLRDEAGMKQCGKERVFADHDSIAKFVETSKQHGKRDVNGKHWWFDLRCAVGDYVDPNLTAE